ncbi:MAG: PorT family protein [Chitinophagaceae bacterium]|nr:PorT family protein [Chitinophagaceae bacterium]
MKKIVCAASLVLFAFCMVHAQQTSFGIRAGFNASSVGIEDGADYNSKTGIHLGGLAHIHITDHFAFQPELIFSAQGGKDDDNDEIRLKLNYVNIPLLVQYMTRDGFRLQTGPQLGFLASAKSKVGDVEVDIKDDLESTELAWVFGAGYLFPRGNGLGIDIRYNHGISNISEDNDFEARNRTFQIGIFYQFSKARSGKRR